LFRVICARSVEPMQEYMVEQYLPGLTPGEVDDASARLAAAADDMVAGGAELKYLGSTYLPEEDSCFSRFKASSSEVVRGIFEQARLPVARIHAVRSLPGHED
jgi:Protein of unknown function (DUF4242)